MIRFSKKEDYAVVLINKLVQNYSKRFIPLSEIAKEYKISVLFLRNLAGQLRKSGIIKANEGKNGGYSLAREPKEIKIGEVLGVFSKKPMLDCCPLETLKLRIKCAKEDYCIPGFAWRRLNKDFLEKIYNLNLEEFLSKK